MALPLVSIIVPIYNAAEYLNKCLTSIKYQTYQNIEVLLINDGSTDNSLNICTYFASLDSRFHVITKPNSGVSATRNFGISLAKGTYLQFVDCDDWLVTTATESMVNAALSSNSDLVITHFYRVVGNRVSPKGHIPHSEVMNRSQFAAYMMDAPANYYYGVMWNKLYRKDLIDTHHIHCEEELNWCEDFLFNLEYLQYAETICSISEPTYYYVKNPNSLVSTEINMKKLFHVKLYLFNYYKELYQDIALYEKHRLKIQKFLIASAKDGGVDFKPLSRPKPYPIQLSKSSKSHKSSRPSKPSKLLNKPDLFDE